MTIYFLISVNGMQSQIIRSTNRNVRTGNDAIDAGTSSNTQSQILPISKRNVIHKRNVGSTRTRADGENEGSAMKIKKKIDNICAIIDFTKPLYCSHICSVQN